jgi:hypothetical protein
MDFMNKRRALNPLLHDVERVLEYQVFMRRYFAFFITGFAFSVVVLSGTISLAFAEVPALNTLDVAVPYVTTLVCGLIVSFGHFAVVRGRYWGAWVIAGVILACLAVLLPLYGYRPHMGVYVIDLLAGLLGLLTLNSRRYRQMRVILAQYRDRRNSERQALARRPKVIRRRRG